MDMAEFRPCLMSFSDFSWPPRREALIFRLSYTVVWGVRSLTAEPISERDLMISSCFCSSWTCTFLYYALILRFSSFKSLFSWFNLSDYSLLAFFYWSNSRHFLSRSICKYSLLIYNLQIRLLALSSCLAAPSSRVYSFSKSSIFCLSESI
jgi:hypothetical protein